MFVTCIKSTNENGTSCSSGRYGLWNTFRSSSGSQGIPSGLLHSNPPCTYINILVRISTGSRSPTFGSLNPDPQKYPRSPMKVTKYNPKCTKIIFCSQKHDLHELWKDKGLVKTKFLVWNSPITEEKWGFFVQNLVVFQDYFI